ncbi:MAG: PAS domain-containing protein, partial [Gammaproteobacteria bacterium]|nr:PAS domain-containing protein [Gammaproteobacteria bacterium]
MTRRNRKSWRDEKTGLTIIAAALVVIALIVVLLFQHQRETRRDRVRVQAISLARVLAEMPVSQLVPQGNQRGVLRALSLGHDNGDFAYATVRSQAGEVVTEVAAPGVIPPATTAHTGNSLSESLVRLAKGRNVLQISTPIFENGMAAGHLSLGYHQPGFGLQYEQLPFFATLALVIFLLAPVSYFATRREIRPLQAATEKMELMLEMPQGAELQPSGELSDFMGRFNDFVGRMQTRIGELEQDHSTMLTSTKLINYRKSRVEGVLESLPEALIVLDETGSISFANARIESLFGVTAADLVGSSDLSWCSDASVCEFLSRCVQTGPGSYAASAVQFALPSSPDKTYGVSAYPLFSPGETGQALGTLAVFRDVTGEALAKRSRGEFVAHVAHELKTPLNILGMYSEVLLDGGNIDESRRIECINVIHDEVDRLAGLVRNLLSITQIEMGGMQPTMSRSRVRDLLVDLFQQFEVSDNEKGLHFELNLPQEISAMDLDKDLMRVALTNLLTNAIKYNKPGGTVKMTAVETDQALVISVSDDGIGISDEDKLKVFDKFYRSEDEQVRERSGHGLGLSLARDIVHLHGGDLTVQDSETNGSEFVVTLWKE